MKEHKNKVKSDIKIVEVGMLLNKNLIFYHDMLVNNGFKLKFSCVTHDIYYCKQSLAGLTENQMKKACVRIRFCNTLNLEDKDDFQLKEEQQSLLKDEYTVAFDTIKFDFQYYKDDSVVQLQDIKDIGLVVYYDNKKYYCLLPEKQREALLDDLNTFGFNFNKNDLGIDKLRTLYYHKKMFSKDQNA